MRKKSETARADALIRESVRGYRARIALITALRVAEGALYMLFALLTRALIDSAVAGDAQGVWRSCAFLLALALLLPLINMLVRWLDGSTQDLAAIRLRTRLYDAILRKKQADLSAFHSAVLLDRLTKDVADVIAYPVAMLPGFIGTLAGQLFAVWALLRMNWMIPVVFLGAGLALSAVGRLFQLRAKRNYRFFREAREKMDAYYQETLSNSLMLKVFRAQKQALSRANAFEADSYGRWRTWFVYNQWLKHAVQAFFQLGYLGALLFGAALLMKSRVTFGGLTAILQLIGQIQDPFSALGELFSTQSVAQSAAERLLALEDLPAERADGAADGWALYGKMASIEARDVRFDYGRSAVFVGASAEIKKGEFVAVTGASGAGKSTLIKLLLGVYEDYEGRIELVATDGERVPLNSGTRSLFAYVPQEHMVFGGSVRENLTFLCGQTTDEAIWEAARQADAEDFLRALPDGLDTLLGEQGLGLSEGQSQRLAVARALLARAPILVLDEATSALDEATETRVLENIRAMGGITLLIISHRRAAIRICDREWLVRDGKIEGRPLTHDR